MFRSLFARKPKSPARRNNGVRQGASPRRNNRALRGLRGIVAAKRGGHRWATRARQAINNRGRPAAQSPRRRNNNVMVEYNGQIMTIKGMEQQKQYKRLLRAGVPNNVAWKRVGGRSIYN